jgi:hypothetical protein
MAISYHNGAPARQTNPCVSHLGKAFGDAPAASPDRIK